MTHRRSLQSSFLSNSIILLWACNLAYNWTSASYLSLINYNIFDLHLSLKRLPGLRYFGCASRSHQPTLFWTFKSANINKLLLLKTKSLQRPTFILGVLLVLHLHPVECYYLKPSLAILSFNVIFLNLVILAVSQGYSDRNME